MSTPTTSRRSFFQSLATIGAAVTLAPNVFLPRLAAPWVLNPEWVKAGPGADIRFLFTPDAFRKLNINIGDPLP